MLVSILIVNWNTRDLDARVPRLLRRTRRLALPYEVIVVDNGSVDGSAEALSERAGHRVCSATICNLGFAAAVNQAFRRSHGDYVLLLNSDVDTRTRRTERARSVSRRARAGCRGGPVYVNPDGSPQPFHFRFPTFATTLANGSSLVRRLLPGSERAFASTGWLDDDFSRPRPVPQPSASCLLLRRSVLPRGAPLGRALSALLQRCPVSALTRRPRARALGDAGRGRGARCARVGTQVASRRKATAVRRRSCPHAHRIPNRPTRSGSTARSSSPRTSRCGLSIGRMLSAAAICSPRSTAIRGPCRLDRSGRRHDPAQPVPEGSPRS